MNNSNSPFSASLTAQLPTHEETSRRAQELWEKYGRPSGRDDEIWLEAERELQQNASSGPGPSVEPAPTSAAATDAPATPATPANPPARAPQRPSRASATARMPGAGRGSRGPGK